MSTHETRRAQDLLAISTREMTWLIDNDKVDPDPAATLRILNQALVLADENDPRRIEAINAATQTKTNQTK